LHPAVATCWWDYCGGNEQNCHLVSLQETCSSGEWHYKLLVHVTTEMNSFIPPTIHYLEIGVSYLAIWLPICNMDIQLRDDTSSIVLAR